MGRLFAMLFGIMLGGVSVYFGFHYHVVRTDETCYVIKKNQVTLVDAYVDARGWDFQQWSRNPGLSEAMIRAGHGEVVQEAISSGVLDNIFRRMGGQNQ